MFPTSDRTAMFGVYGMLGLGLVLFCFRSLTSAPAGAGVLGINIGLALAVLLCVRPVGLLQVQASVERGMWYARSPGFVQTDTIQTLRWLRVIGDRLFAFGGLFRVVRARTEDGLVACGTGGYPASRGG
jgi:nitric oxide reductase subunit B